MINTADVIIIGGGMQGSSLAFHLARHGTKGIVLERQFIGAGATGCSSGFTRTGLCKLSGYDGITPD